MSGIRYVQVLMLFFVNMISYAAKTNLNLALIAMTDKSNEQYFDIDLKIQGTLQSSLFWGYFVGVFPAGYAATRFGGRRLLLASVVVTAMTLIALPFSRLLGPNGWKMIYGCRIIQGLFQALISPCCLTLMSKWIPVEERSRLGSLTFSGIQLGNAFQLLTSSYLISYWGWPSIFYFHASLFLLWLVVYAFVGAESPALSKLISEEEKIYIQKSLDYKQTEKKPQIPWTKLMTSIPFIISIVAHCGFKWGYYTLLTQIPNYLKRIHDMDLKENGAISALPYLVLFLSAYPVGFLADFILKMRWLQLTTIRKIFTTFGFLGPAAWLIGLSQATPQDRGLAVAFLTLAVANTCGIFSGSMLNQLDMAPSYTGVMNGVTNVFANVMTILAPIVAGFLLGEGTHVSDWQTVFYVSVGVYIVTWVVYVIFGDHKRQPWSEADDTQVNK